MPEAQSLTLIIQGVLGELVPEQEVAEAPDAVEEEDSSSTPGRRTWSTKGPPV